MKAMNCFQSRYGLAEVVFNTALFSESEVVEMVSKSWNFVRVIYMKARWKMRKKTR